jgi:hypothetical protein
MVELKEQKAATDSPEFAKLLATVPLQARQAWGFILGIALGSDLSDGRDDPVLQMLVRLRNTVAFHYSAKILCRGYQRHFSSAEKVHTSRAVFSDGKSMETTRFHFADAAAEEAIYEATKIETRNVAGRIGELVGYVNLALKPIVTAYLRSVATATPYSDS